MQTLTAEMEVASELLRGAHSLHIHGLSRCGDFDLNFDQAT
jgi:hypothetical protein